MLEELEEMIKEMNDSAILEVLAKGYRKMYLALIFEGFSKEEAMRICTARGLSLK